MTSGQMLKLTVVLVSVCAMSYVAFDTMLDVMDEAELMRVATDKRRILKHPIVTVTGVTYTVTKVAAAVSAAMTAVLWLMGA